MSAVTVSERRVKAHELKEGDAIVGGCVTGVVVSAERVSIKSDSVIIVLEDATTFVCGSSEALDMYETVTIVDVRVQVQQRTS